LELARHAAQEPVRVSQISELQKIPVKYLEQIIRALRTAGLVSSIRGPKGGYILAKKPEDITLGRVVRLFEGQTDLVECISLPERCDMSDECQVRLAWQEATLILFAKLDGITIAALLARSRRSRKNAGC